MTTLLILWAGQTGHTHALAAAAADAARLAAPAQKSFRRQAFGTLGHAARYHRMVR